MFWRQESCLKTLLLSSPRFDSRSKMVLKHDHTLAKLNTCSIHRETSICANDAWRWRKIEMVNQDRCHWCTGMSRPCNHTRLETLQQLQFKFTEFLLLDIMSSATSLLICSNLDTKNCIRVDSNLGECRSPKIWGCEAVDQIVCWWNNCVMARETRQISLFCWVIHAFHTFETEAIIQESAMLLSTSNTAPTYGSTGWNGGILKHRHTGSARGRRMIDMNDWDYKGQICRRMTIDTGPNWKIESFNQICKHNVNITRSCRKFSYISISWLPVETQTSVTEF